MHAVLISYNLPKQLMKSSTIFLNSVDLFLLFISWIKYFAILSNIIWLIEIKFNGSFSPRLFFIYSFIIISDVNIPLCFGQKYLLSI